ncbi:MAG: endonuclease/exonuclease/phosphatase family protein [Dermatophilaceae bacterium]
MLVVEDEPAIDNANNGTPRERTASHGSYVRVEHSDTTSPTSPGSHARHPDRWSTEREVMSTHATRNTTAPASRKGRLAAIVGLVFAVVASLGVLGATPAQAAGPDQRTCTWNMQGASHVAENKWNHDVQPLMSNCDVLALQEAGSVPASATQVGTYDLSGGTIGVYNWGGTASRPAYQIYWMQTDPNGNRVNLAIVAPVGTASRVATFFVTGQKRPVLGVLIGNTWYFSIHANASGPNDVQGILTHINHEVEVVYQADHNAQYDWVVLGDFNTSPAPGNFPLVSDWVIPPNGPTHNANLANPTSQLDFAATNSTDHPPQGLVELQVHNSDHYPVYYNFAACYACAAQ